jgi:hypothetical protein
MYDFANLTDAELARCGHTLRDVGSAASSMEYAANRIVTALYENITDSATWQKANALVRFYKTHPYSRLNAGLQDFARGILGSNSPSDELRCLTLLGTIGDQEQWNSRTRSAGHQAIPLASADMVSGISMIARLINQFGIDVGAVMQPNPMLIGDLSKKTFNTFCVPEAAGSPYIPFQDDFVIRYGIKSVLGFGGVLSSGELFVVIMFSKVSIPSNTAEIFNRMAICVKDAVEPFVGNKVFA